METYKHICIVGDGAAGWMTYHSLKNFPGIEKITVIGSPSIPKIGVGESTALAFRNWLIDLNLSDCNLKKFLFDIDAAVKYGVSYEGWSPKTFLHHFNANWDQPMFGLGGKPVHVSHNDVAVPLAKHIYDNNVYLSSNSWGLDQNLQRSSFHFDASKFIDACYNLAKNDNQLNYISDTVIDAAYQGQEVDKLILESGLEVKADYYISCIGQTAFNQKVFREEYVSYSDYLLTTKALFSPIEYKDPVGEFHPFTIARTMPNGWRWITPTRSRIGTGYVFSDNHISVDEAVNEFRKDAGIPNLQPHVVDFWPRRVKKVFKSNMCTIGMASGFQEPLDAPGLTLTASTIGQLQWFLTKSNQSNTNKTNLVNDLNEQARHVYDFWCCFILHQYKTCHRSDTTFWRDHKQVKFNVYDVHISHLFDDPQLKINNDCSYYKQYKQEEYDEFFSRFIESPACESYMFYNTTSGKDIRWNVSDGRPYMNQHQQLPIIDTSRIISHREFIDGLFSKNNDDVMLYWY